MGVTPLPRYSGPVRHPPAFGRLPGLAVYTTYLAPADFSAGTRGLHQPLSVSLSPCCRFHPAEVRCRIGQISASTFCLRPMDGGSALGSAHFEATYRVYCHYGPVTRNLPMGDLVDGLQDLGGFGRPRHPAIRTTGLLTFALAGLAPAEHTSLTGSQHPSCAFAPFHDPGRIDDPSPMTVSSMLPLLLTKQRLQRVHNIEATAGL